MFLEENCFCNKASNRIVLTSKGFSVFFWITLSHEVSRHFPRYTYINIRELKEPSTYSRYTTDLQYPFIGGESNVLWKEEKQILDHQ